MWSVALFLLGAVAGDRVAPESLRPAQIACLGEKTVVGLSEDSQFIYYDGAAWQKSALTERTSDLWRAPDGRVFTWSWDLVVEVREPIEVAARWRLRKEGPIRVARLGDHFAAASVRGLYRLDPGGIVTFEGVTPLNPQAERPHTPPVLLDSDLGTVICTASSATEATRIRGHCLGPYKNRYSYRAEFGTLPWPDEGDNGAEPFICSNVVVSARNRGTQARQISDGVQVGRAAVFARRGSQCLSDGRVLLVGQREVGVFTLPSLRRLWRRPLPAKVRDVALCGGKIAVLASPGPALTTFDIPADIVHE